MMCHEVILFSAPWWLCFWRNLGICIERLLAVLRLSELASVRICLSPFWGLPTRSVHWGLKVDLDKGFSCITLCLTLPLPFVLIAFAVDVGLFFDKRRAREYARRTLSRTHLPMHGNFLLIYIWNFHVLNHLLLIYICKLHWNRPLFPPFKSTRVI